MLILFIYFSAEKSYCFYSCEYESMDDSEMLNSLSEILEFTNELWLRGKNTEQTQVGTFHSASLLLRNTTMPTRAEED